MNKKQISVVIPCFNEEEAIPIYYKSMCPVMDKMEAVFELIFVDDGSTDGTMTVLQELSSQDSRCCYLSFSRNFGKESAIYAGLKYAQGDFAVVMDVDLQDPPYLLPRMYQAVAQGEFDSAAAFRSTRTGEPKIRSFLSDRFYKCMNRISQTQMMPGARDYRMMNRKMLDAVLQMSEYNRFSKGIFSWVGFRTKWIPFENVERSAGNTKWHLGKLFRYSLDGITGFSAAPLSMASVLGVAFCFFSFGMIIFLVIRTLIWGDPTPGWPSIACIIFMVSGIQLLCIGIMGEYLSKTYMETKHRPLYIVRSSSYTKELSCSGDGLYGEVKDEQ